MKKQRKTQYIRKSIAVPAMILLLAITLAGCGKAEDNKEVTAAETPEATASVSPVPTEPEEEPSEEPSMEPEEKPEEELTTEEWVETIKKDDTVLFILNETTGVRKVLSEGEEYVVSDGDILGFWWPLDWTVNESSGVNQSVLYTNVENKYECIIFYLDDVEDEEFENRMQIIGSAYDTNGDKIVITAYLIK